VSPTARALRECKRRGWVAQTVEQTIPRTFIKRDFLGVIDIIAIVPSEAPTGVFGVELVEPGTIIGIQVTSGSNHAARIAKAKAEPRLTAWLNAGARFVVWSWAKQGGRGKRKQWRLREEAVTQ
jgi:hypothetical protein